MEDMELYDDDLVKLQLHNLLMAVIFYLISVLVTQRTYKEYKSLRLLLIGSAKVLEYNYELYRYMGQLETGVINHDCREEYLRNIWTSYRRRIDTIYTKCRLKSWADKYYWTRHDRNITRISKSKPHSSGNTSRSRSVLKYS